MSSVTRVPVNGKYAMSPNMMIVIAPFTRTKSVSSAR